MPSLRQTQPLIGRFLVPRDVLLVWEPKTPKNSLKKPFFDQKWHHQGTSTQTGTSVNARTTVYTTIIIITIEQMWSYHYFAVLLIVFTESTENDSQVVAIPNQNEPVDSSDMC